MGLVTGLRNGFNVLTARVPGAGAQIAITNHPIGGPVFSGAQVQPWTCSTTSNPSLGPADRCAVQRADAVSATCIARPPTRSPPTTRPAPRPANMATTTTDQGVTVDYIVRIERGTMNRGIHEIAVLFDPTQPWTPWQPQPQWNHKVLMLYGAGTSQVYSQGTPGSVQSNEPLSRGFAVATSSMLINSLHANFVTAAETTMMLKEHIIETLGEIRYTIGEGNSGGALLQHLTADSYPGLLDGLRITNAQDWEESISGAYREFADSGALVHAFTTSSADLHARRTARRSAAGAPPTSTSSTSRPADCPTTTSPTTAPTAPAPRATTPTRIRPACAARSRTSCRASSARVPQDGFANLVFDNVGVQYGLTALLAGHDHARQVRRRQRARRRLRRERRLAAAAQRDDAEVAALLHRTGNVTYGRQLGKVPEIATRSTNNNDYHYPFRTYVNRARLIAPNGNADNHVFWTALPSSRSARLLAMDRWLAAIEADHERRSDRDEDRPRQARGHRQRVLDQRRQGHGPGRLRRAVPVFPRAAHRCRRSLDDLHDEVPAQAAGRGRLPGVTFTDAQWAALQATFPTGVCDFSKPGVGFQPNVPWLTYAGGPGGAAARRAPVRGHCSRRRRSSNASQAAPPILDKRRPDDEPEQKLAAWCSPRPAVRPLP